jgi:hypothetical protein
MARRSALVWGFPRQELSSHGVLLSVSSFLVRPLGPFLRPDRGSQRPARSRAQGSPPGRPRQRRASGLERGEHGARLRRAGRNPLQRRGALAGRIGGEFAIARQSVRRNLVFGRSRGIGTMMQSCASAANSGRRAHSTTAAQRPWAEAGHRPLGSGSARAPLTRRRGADRLCSVFVWFGLSCRSRGGPMQAPARQGLRDGAACRQFP